MLRCRKKSKMFAISCNVTDSNIPFISCCKNFVESSEHLQKLRISAPEFSKISAPENSLKHFGVSHVDQYLNH